MLTLFSRFTVIGGTLSAARRSAVWGIDRAFALGGIFIVSTALCHGELPEDQVLDHVDPFIGTDATGHVYPGATVPFGMVQPSPDTRNDDWSSCGGYHHQDRSIMGFSQTHFSGTGAGDLGDFLLMPRTGPVRLQPGTAEDPGSGYRSPFRHETQRASPGYYAVRLDDTGIEVELTATERVAYHRYTFPEADSAHVLLDMLHIIRPNKDDGRVRWAYLRQVDDQTVQGWRITDNWAKNRYLAFTLRFSKPFKEYTLYRDGRPARHWKFPGQDVRLPEESGTRLKGAFHFDMEAGEALDVKIALSSVSPGNALRNMEAEVPDWSFERVHNAARASWSEALSKIDVAGDAEFLTIFYTALYRTHLSPVIYEDVDGRYRGLDHDIHRSEGFANYGIFSLWDSFRTLHPLATLIHPERTGDFVASMMAHYDQSAHRLLPIWSFHGNETFTMYGYHSVPVLIDAYFKGLTDIDGREILAACVETARNRDLMGLGDYMDLGYVPIDRVREGGSITLEFAYDDWCIARLAAHLGEDAIAQAFRERSRNYVNLWDEATGFFRARTSSGEFLEPFEPRAVKRPDRSRDYTEGNAWHWLWFVPHEPERLFDLLGGREAAAAKLDEMFAMESETIGTVPDVTGLIGQYAHGNEPGHHVIYLYALLGQAWKAQERLREVCERFYTDQPDGLIGNEDCGQMSAWYVMTTLGFYPLNPSSGRYVIGAPMTREAAIRLGDGRSLVVRAPELSEENIYVQSVAFNGDPIEGVYLEHEAIVRGGELVFTMGPEPKLD